MRRRGREGKGERDTYEVLLARDVAVVVAPAVEVGAVELGVAGEGVQGVEEAVARVVLVELAVLAAHALEQPGFLVEVPLAEGWRCLGDHHILDDRDDDLVDGGGLREEVVLGFTCVSGPPLGVCAAREGVVGSIHRWLGPVLVC